MRTMCKPMPKHAEWQKKYYKYVCVYFSAADDADDTDLFLFKHGDTKTQREVYL